MMSNYSTYSDGELLQLLQNGDENAFATIYDRYWKTLLLTAYNRMDQFEDAQELVQDLFIKLWDRRTELAVQYSLYTYLQAAVKYRVINYYSSRAYNDRPERLPDNVAAKLETGNTSSAMEIRELEDQINGIVNALPQKCRLVFSMSRGEQYTHRMIAKELNISEKTVQAHISLALDRLKAGIASLWSLALYHFFL